MISKDIEFDTWLLNMELPWTIGDEFALYALCRLFNRYARVITRGNTWHTVSVEGTYGEKYVEDVCDIHLLFLVKDTIAELKQRTTIIDTQPVETQPVPAMVKPLGLCNMELPEIELPELLDETVLSTSGIQTKPDTLKSDTMGTIIPLPEEDLEIAPDLLQHDPLDTFEMETDKLNPRSLQPKSVPCSINLKCLSDHDIAKWQVHKTPVTLLDATLNMPDKITAAISANVDVPKYNLRTRDPDTGNSKPLSIQPQREASKSVTYAEPTDESS